MRFSLRWLGFGLLILAIAAPSFAADREFVFVRARKARVRSVPSVQGEVLATAKFGERLYSLEKAEGWYRVRLEDGSVGWVYEEQVTDDQPESLFVEARRAEIRRAKTMESRVVAVVENGTELRSIDKQDDWYLVQLEKGKQGWIHEDLVDDSPPGILFVKRISAFVRSSPSPMSEILAEVGAGTELGEILKIDDYYQVELDGGRTGWVEKHAVTDELPERLYVDVPEAQIKTDPTKYGAVKAKVVEGTELVSFDKEDDFFLVVTPGGELGWIYDENVIRLGR